jgi:hypothetical protein
MRQPSQLPRCDACNKPMARNRPRFCPGCEALSDGSSGPQPDSCDDEQEAM